MSMMGHFQQVTPAQLEEIANDEAVVAELIEQEIEVEAGLDIDKNWHGVHFLLTGDAWGGTPPLAEVVMGGEEVGEDMGYGAARLLLPAKVKSISTALNDVSTESLRAKYNPAEMSAADIYPGNWDDEEDLDYLLESYAQLVEFYRDAAAKGNGMLVYLL